MEGEFCEFHPILDLFYAMGETLVLIYLRSGGEVFDGVFEMLHMVLYVASIDEEIRVFALKVFFLGQSKSTASL